MGRAGRGGGGGGRSGGGHSSFRSSGGHRAGSSRAGSGSSFSRNRGSGFSRRPPRPPRPRSRRTVVYVNNGNYSGTPRRRSSTLGSVLSVVIVLIIILIAAYVFMRGGGLGDVSTIERTKLDNPSAYDNNCIVDELGWFDNVSRTEKELMEFYDETGVQPYIVLNAYDSSLTTDSQKEEWAQEYYEQNIDNETTMLYVYFAEEDTDNAVGYMCYVLGKQANSVMDSEAIDIFWGQIDRYWYSDLSTDEVFTRAFNNTASTIMKTYTSVWDVAKIALIVIVVIVVIAGVISIMRVKRRNEAEKAEETERILKASMDDLVGDAEKGGDSSSSGIDSGA